MAPESMRPPMEHPPEKERGEESGTFKTERSEPMLPPMPENLSRVETENDNADEEPEVLEVAPIDPNDLGEVTRDMSVPPPEPGKRVIPSTPKKQAEWKDAGFDDVRKPDEIDVVGGEKLDILPKAEKAFKQDMTQHVMPARPDIKIGDPGLRALDEMIQGHEEVTEDMVEVEKTLDVHERPTTPPGQTYVERDTQPAPPMDQYVDQERKTLPAPPAESDIAESKKGLGGLISRIFKSRKE